MIRLSSLSSTSSTVFTRSVMGSKIHLGRDFASSKGLVKRTETAAAVVQPRPSSLRFHGARQLDQWHRGTGDLGHLPVPALRHLVLDKVERNAARQELVGLCLCLGLGQNRLG